MAESDDKKNELTESGRDGKSGKQKETNEKRRGESRGTSFF